MTTDDQLIARARGGETAAFRLLYERHADRVFSVVRRIAGDDGLAEEWAQEAWVRVYRALPRFRGEARFATWLHRIAVNCALHGRRGVQRRQRREERAVVPDIHPSHGDGTLLRMRLDEALDGLPERMRAVLVLHDVEGYTHEEIGEMLGVAAGTSKSQLFRARARMRELLAGNGMKVEKETEEKAWTP
jgi:RNA polymerase sigma-70 factor, ECF subfamily